MGDDRASVYAEIDPASGNTSLIYRASSFGSCPRSLTLHRLGYDPMPWPAGIQRAFDAGNVWEDILVDYMRRPHSPNDMLSGWSIYGQQREYDLELLPNKIIRVHIDALGTRFFTDTDTLILDLYHDEPDDNGGESFVVEYKSFGGVLMKKWKKSGVESMPHYAVQFSIEMLATNRPLLAVIVDKEATEKLRLIDPDADPVISWKIYTEPPVSKAELIRMMMHIDQSVKNFDASETGLLPDCGDHILDGGYCPFYKFHDAKPESTAMAELVNSDDETKQLIASSIEEKVRWYRKLNEDVKNLTKQRDEYKDELRELLAVDASYSIDGKDIGFYTTHPDKWDYDSLIAAAQAAGIDTSQYVSSTDRVTIRG